MAHDNIFGYCENLCKVEVEPKSRTENLYNPNLLVNCDDFVINAALIDGTSNNSFNVTLNNTIYYANGFTPLTVESSGDIEMRYQITGQPTLSANRLPMTLQVRFGAVVGTDITIKTYVFDETDDEFTEIMGSVTWRITLTGYSAKIYWTKTAGVQSEYMLAGAKLELGNVPTRFDLSNTSGKTIDLVWTESKNRFETKSNKVTSISSSSTNAQYPSAKSVYDMSNQFEKKSNKVTYVQLLSSSTNDQYPSAKTVYDALKLFLSGGDNDTWAGTPNGIAQWFFYEGADTTLYYIPTPNCIVIVFKKTATRGVAFAFGWDWDGVSTNKSLWKNTNHDGWRGWTSLHTN